MQTRPFLIIAITLSLSGCLPWQRNQSASSPEAEPIAPQSSPSIGNGSSVNKPGESKSGESKSRSQPQQIPPQHPNASPPLPRAKSPSTSDLAFLNQPYDVLDEFAQAKFQVTSPAVFSTSSFPNVGVSFDANKLLAVLINTRAYFTQHSQQDPKVLRDGLLGRQGITIADILNTLNFMIAILQEDIAANRPTRLKDPEFLQQHFETIRWNPYNPQNAGQEQLRITKYAIFTHSGSRTKTSTYDTALYHLTPTSDSFHRRYTKQDVLSGIYESGGKEFGRVQPLAYLTRNGLEEALLQGTILVNFTDGTSAFFNVDINNGIAFIPGVSQIKQHRYWYFKQVDAIKGYGYRSEAKISIQPGVTFAGDIYNIGLGRILALDTVVGGRRTIQLGVIADTGGAFAPNLHQVDFLAGIFPNRAAFSSYSAQLSSHATAYILVRRQ